MSVTGSVYYSYLKSIGACQEGLDYVGTQSCQEATEKCCPTPELANLWFGSLPEMATSFSDIENNYIKSKILEKQTQFGYQAAKDWIFDRFGQFYIDDVNTKTLVTQNLISHIDTSVPHCYSGSGQNILDLSGNLSDGLLVGDFNFNSGYISHLNLGTTESYIDFGEKFWYNPPSNPMSVNFTFRLVVRFNNLSPENNQKTNLLSRGDDNCGFKLEIDHKNIKWSSTNSVSQLQTITSQDLINENLKWYDICVTSKDSELTIYRNGQKVTNALIINPPNWTDSRFIIGLSSFDFMSFVSYSRGLSEEEVLRNFRSIKGRFSINK